MVVPTFVRQAPAERPLTAFGDGTPRRVGHGNDVVRALADPMEQDSHYGEVFNVGSDEEISIRELAGVVRERCESSSEIVLVPYAEAYEAASRTWSGGFLTFSSSRARSAGSRTKGLAALQGVSVA